MDNPQNTLSTLFTGAVFYWRNSQDETEFHWWKSSSPCWESTQTTDAEGENCLFLLMCFVLFFKLSLSSKWKSDDCYVAFVLSSRLTLSLLLLHCSLHLLTSLDLSSRLLFLLSCSSLPLLVFSSPPLSSPHLTSALLFSPLLPSSPPHLLFLLCSSSLLPLFFCFSLCLRLVPAHFMLWFLKKSDISIVLHLKSNLLVSDHI